MLLKRLYDEHLAQASYLLGCAATGEALVIDPNRDVEQYLEAAAAEGLRITHVTETHIHADFVSGSRELAARSGGALLLSVEGGPDWQYAFPEAATAVHLRDGSRFSVGNIRVEVLHTPGHTPEHMAFLVTDGAASTEPYAIFSGDFVFVGDVGRPDLLEKAARIANTMEGAARTLYASLARFRALPEYVQVYPGHGAGSACGKSLGALPSSTVGYELRTNWGLQAMSEDMFVTAVLSGQPEPPPYFAQMKHINTSGPALLGKLAVQTPLPPATYYGVQRSGAVLLDVRPATAYAAGHLPGTLNIPLGKSFVTWAGWLMGYDAPIYLVAETAAAAFEARRLLSLIGLDHVVGCFDAATLDAEAERLPDGLPRVQQIDAEELAAALRTNAPHILDVRNVGEFETGHLPGAQNIPLGQLPQRLSELPSDASLVVHCAAGTRSAMAVSVLQRSGFTQLANLAGGFAAWRAQGLPEAASLPVETR